MDMEKLREKLDSCVTSGIGIMISWSDAKDILQLKTENERLRGEKPIPSAWWKDCPGMAQRTMERIIAENKRLEKQICDGANALSVAEETIANLGTAIRENEKLKKALKKHGSHSNQCASYQVVRRTMGMGVDKPNCDCGFEQALKGAAKDGEEKKE